MNLYERIIACARAAGVTPARSEKRKVARDALLRSQGRWLDGDTSTRMMHAT